MMRSQLLCTLFDGQFSYCLYFTLLSVLMVTLMNTMKRWIAIFSSIALMIAFCLMKASHAGFNADDISPYSFAQDLLQGVSVTDWNFPAPTFIFPDILITIPIVYLFKTPERWFYLAACLQWLALVLLIARYRKVNFPGIVYAGLLINKLGEYYFNLPWQAVASRMFVMVNHMSAALLALACYVWLASNSFKANKNKLIILLPLFFLSAFSDLFFMLYFFAFVSASVLMSYRQTVGSFLWLKLIIPLFISGSVGVGLNAYLNPNFFVQIHHSYQTVSIFLRFSNLMTILQSTGRALFIGVPMALMIIAAVAPIKEQQKKLIFSLLGGLLLFLLGVALTGMIVDKYALRYLGVYFPVIVFVITLLLPSAYYRYSMNIIVSLIALYFANQFLTKSWPLKTDLYTPKIQTVLSCAAFQQNNKNALVVATYWPAKILFEKSQRVFHLKQTAPDLTSVYHWIYNPSWMEGVTHKKTLYVTLEASEEAIFRVKHLPHAREICEGSVILVDENKRK